MDAGNPTQELVYKKELEVFQEKDIVMTDDMLQKYDSTVDIYNNPKKQVDVTARVYTVKGKEVLVFFSRKLGKGGMTIFNHRKVFHVNLLAKKDLLFYVVYDALLQHNGMGNLDPQYIHPDLRPDATTWNNFVKGLNKYE